MSTQSHEQTNPAEKTITELMAEAGLTKYLMTDPVRMMGRDRSEFDVYYGDTKNRAIAGAALQLLYSIGKTNTLVWNHDYVLGANRIEPEALAYKTLFHAIIRRCDLTHASVPRPGVFNIGNRNKPLELTNEFEFTEMVKRT